MQHPNKMMDLSKRLVFFNYSLILADLTKLAMEAIGKELKFEKLTE